MAIWNSRSSDKRRNSDADKIPKNNTLRKMMRSLLSSEKLHTASTTSPAAESSIFSMNAGCQNNALNRIDYISIGSSLPPTSQIPYTPYNPKRQLLWFLIRRILFCLIGLIMCLVIYQFIRVIHESLQTDMNDITNLKGYQQVHLDNVKAEEYFDIKSNTDNLAMNQNLLLYADIRSQNITWQPPPTELCKIALVTTFPPEKCGIAEFSDHLYESFERIFPVFASKYNINCSIKVIVLHDHS